MVDASLLEMTLADYIIAGIIIISVIISLLRGFVREALSLANWGVAFWVALNFNDKLSDVLTPYIATPSLRLAASFGMLFIFTLIIGSLVSFLISRLVVSTGLSGTDRSLGLIFGLARGILLIGIALLMISFTAFAKDDWYQKSILIPHFQSLVIWLKGFLPETMKKLSEMVTQYT